VGLRITLLATTDRLISMKLDEFLRDIYVPLRGISAQTESLYKMTIAEFGKSLGHPPTLDDFDELKVAKFLAQRVRERKPATAAKDRSQLRALWELAARRRMVELWPTIKRVRVPERVPEAWLTDEMARILASAALETTKYDGIPAALWWRALLLVCYDTGERITPIVSLRWRDIRENQILYVAENRKGSRRDILRPIGEGAMAALDAIRMGRGEADRVFPWPRVKNYLWKRLEIILKRAGLPSDRSCKFHKIRKTTASYAEAAGLSAQAILDHSDPKTTRRYLDPRIVSRRSAVDVLPKVS
jgi:integrase